MSNFAYELTWSRNTKKKCLVFCSLSGLVNKCDPRGKKWKYTGRSKYTEEDRPKDLVSNPMEMRSEDGSIIYVHPESLIEFIDEEA